MNLSYEKKKIKLGYANIIGCDEVGRGCLAGPVVAAAVILNVDFRIKKGEFKDIKDSKLLAAKKREELSVFIKKHFLWSIGVVSQTVVDEINIHHASLLAMKKAVNGLNCQDAFVVVDGKFQIPHLGMQQQAIIGGDNKVLSIAAASIIAKVYRDQLMKDLHSRYPIYNFAQHKGYATEHHRAMIIKNGLSPIHRLTFCGNLV